MQGDIFVNFPDNLQQSWPENKKKIKNARDRLFFSVFASTTISDCFSVFLGWQLNEICRAIAMSVLRVIGGIF